jgi:hypothetical protein
MGPFAGTTMALLAGIVHSFKGSTVDIPGLAMIGSILEGRFLELRRSCAAESDVAHAGADHVGPSGGRPVTQAVGGGAQERATLDDLAWDPDPRLGGVEAFLTEPSVGIAGLAGPVTRS